MLEGMITTDGPDVLAYQLARWVASTTHRNSPFKQGKYGKRSQTEGGCMHFQAVRVGVVHQDRIYKEDRFKMATCHREKVE